MPRGQFIVEEDHGSWTQSFWSKQTSCLNSGDWWQNPSQQDYRRTTGLNRIRWGPPTLDKPIFPQTQGQSPSAVTQQIWCHMDKYSKHLRCIHNMVSLIRLHWFVTIKKKLWMNNKASFDLKVINITLTLISILTCHVYFEKLGLTWESSQMISACEIYLSVNIFTLQSSR